MQRLIEKSGANNVFLVVSATSNVESLKKIFKTYENISDYKLIVTKTDEAITESPLLNISDLSKSSISYFAFGQNVPNDIEILNPQTIVGDIVSRMKFEENRTQIGTTIEVETVFEG
jgi:flagellar biosynthesis protein FlhF